MINEICELKKSKQTNKIKKVNLHCLLTIVIIIRFSLLFNKINEYFCNLNAKNQLHNKNIVILYPRRVNKVTA